MAWTDWEGIYARQESSPLDRFKNKNRVLKSFGPPGVRIYDEIDGVKSARSIQTALNIEPSLFARIMEQLTADGAVAIKGQTAAQSAKIAGPSSAEELMMPQAGASASLTLRTGAQDETGQKGEREGGKKESADNAMPSSPPAALIPPMTLRTGDLTPQPPGANLSPLEKLIADKYGPVGLKVYELIDGERTAEDILNETGVSESKLVEILEFMNEQGIIKLDRPLRNPGSPQGGAGAGGMSGGAGGAQGGMGAGGMSGGQRGPMMTGAGGGGAAAKPNPSTEDGVGFKPMVESNDDATEASLSADALPVDVPVLPARMSIIQKAKTMAILATKHGKVGHDLLKHIDGNKDFVQLSVETGLALHDLDIILGELGKAGLLTFKPLNRIEVRHRYGDDGLAIYRRYGRDGLLIYQMIGKVESLREILRRSRIEPQRAVDILIFVHRVLGLELPVDRDMIYRYLTKG